MPGKNLLHQQIFSVTLARFGISLMIILIEVSHGFPRNFQDNISKSDVTSFAEGKTAVA
jgi:hypothetical protein